MSRSVGFSLFAGLGFAVYFIVPADAARADSQRYYFCESTNSFFPYVQSCAMPWKEVDPKPTANTTLALAQPPATSTPPASSAAPDPAPRHGVVAFPIGMPPPQTASASAAPLTVGPVPLAAAQPAEPAAARGPVIFAFGAETPTIVCAVSQLCDVALQAGEKINQIIVGDPDHWRVDPASEGAGFAETTHLIIRPTNPDLDTSLIVLTKTRIYHMRLQSHRRDYMLQVAFSYGERPEAAPARAVEQKAVETDADDDGLVKVGGVTYVKGREPKMLTPKSSPDEPPLPVAAPTPQVTADVMPRSKMAMMPQ